MDTENNIFLVEIIFLLKMNLFQQCREENLALTFIILVYVTIQWRGEKNSCIAWERELSHFAAFAQIDLLYLIQRIKLYPEMKFRVPADFSRCVFPKSTL